MRRERTSLSGALLGSVLLHVGVFAFAMISWTGEQDLTPGTIVPVTMVSNSAFTDLRAAIAAQEAAEAQVEDPAPDAPLEAVVAEPTPDPTPAQPTPQPKAAPAPAPPAKSGERRAQPAEKSRPQPKTEDSFDFAALEESLTRSQTSSGASRSSAARGERRPATAEQATPSAGAGRGLSANSVAGLADELQRRWNPNCEVAGGRDVVVRVVFTLAASGQVQGEVSADQENSPDPVVRAATDRAVRAVYQAAPFRNLPRELYGRRIAVNFNAREACA